MQQAAASGDYKLAAQLEQQRNEKIAGEGMNYTTTNKYSQYLDEPKTYTGSSTGIGVHTTDQQSIKDQMNANSIAWATADEATRAQLAAQNQMLGAQLGGSVAFDSETGYWSGEAEKPKTETSAPTFDYSYYQDSKPTYESSYSAQIDELLNQILNRDSFSYNAQEDPLYQQYASTYEREGQRAMNDTLAAAAASAGGMNSYAISAAQQAQNYYGAQLGDKVPELYQLAYQMYLDDIDRQVQDFGLVQQMDDTQYGRYRDTMGDWRDDRDFAYGAYRDDVGDYQWQLGFDYGTGRDTIADSRYDSETAYDRALSFLNAGVMPESSVLAAAGISPSEAERVIASLQLESAAGGSSSGGGGGGGDTDYTNGGMSKEEIMAIQRELGVTADGLWGPKTQAAYEAKYGDGTPTSDPLAGLLGGGDDPEEEGGAELNWDSINDLGLGPRSASFVLELKQAGGVVEDGNGNVSWAPGWNALNYKERLKAAQSGLPYTSVTAGLFKY